jgi:hypothetical protein
MFVGFVFLIMVVPAVVVVVTARFLARKIAPKWPANLRSTTSTIVMSLAPVGLGLICVVVVSILAPMSNRGSAFSLAVIIAGILWGSCALFLLFLTSHFVADSQRTPVTVRIWLVASLIIAVWIVLAGFALGVSQGTH